MSSEKKIKEAKAVKSVERKDLLSRMRDNPWMLSTVVLGALLLGSLIFAGGKVNDVGEEKVGIMITDFLNSQIDSGEIILESVEDAKGFYVVNVNFNGDKIPVFASLDGEYIFSDAVPTSADTIIPAASPSEGSRAEIDTTNGFVNGDLNAPITIIEFSDYECPFCARFYSETYNRLVENYVETGKAKLVFMDFPLSFHPNAQKAAEAARCYADQGGDYFEYHDVLFENQQSLNEANYLKWAEDLGISDSSAFELCLDSGTFAPAVQASFAEGANNGVSGTPAFFVNGISLSGAQPFEAFEQLIEAELANL